MQTIGNGKSSAAIRNEGLIVRVAKATLSFSVADATAENLVTYRSYDVKAGMSVAANLREAFRQAATDDAMPRLKGVASSGLVITDAPVLLMPAEAFTATAAQASYRHAFAEGASRVVMHTELPSLGAVAVFAVSHDLNVVARDNIADVTFMPVMAPVWNNLYHSSFSGQRQKLYAYFHDGKADIFAFLRGRFRFSNAFDVNNSRDSVYFLLYVWRQLGFDQRRDELHIVGDVPQMQETLDMLRRYVGNTYVINPSADFNRSPVTRIQGMPYDLMTLYVKGL